jgi:hypothetical protein
MSASGCVEETNRLKGFIGGMGIDEVTSAAEVIDPKSLAGIKSLSDEELFALGAKALQDIADDILILDEIHQRFYRAKGKPILGYQHWREFIEKNSRYSVRTIQNRLAEVHGKDTSKVNKETGNQYTRPAAPNDEQGWKPSEPVLKRLEAVNPEVAGRVRAGSLSLRPTKSKTQSDKNPFAEKDYFARVGRGLATAFSGVDDRLNDIARIRKSEWTPEAEEGLRCIILNLKEVSKMADKYAAKLKVVLRKHAK